MTRSRFRLGAERTAQIAVATTMLAVPASAAALTGAEVAASSTTTHTTTLATSAQTPTLAIRVRPRRIVFGRTVTITGAVPAQDAGQQVGLETEPSGATAWRVVATTRSGSDGRFRFRIALRSSGLVRAVVGSTRSATALAGEQVGSATGPAAGSVSRGAASTGTAASGAAASGAAASGTPRIDVAARFHAAQARSRDVLGGTTVVFRGRLLPGQAGRTVRLQGHARHGWRALARARTRRGGRFALRYRVRPGGAIGRRLRLVFAGDRANVRSVRSAGRLTVYGLSVASWYYDAGATACGFHAGYGVANRTLPCGTKVGLRYHGHTVVAVVDDRGPFVGGRSWDLSQTTAAALGFGGVDTVWATR